jgi:hypothetical protein
MKYPILIYIFIIWFHAQNNHIQAQSIPLFKTVAFDQVSATLDVTVIDLIKPHSDDEPEDTLGRYEEIAYKKSHNQPYGADIQSGKTGLDTPTITKNFRGNPVEQYTPTDNSIAVSDAGILVSCINSSVYIYNSSGAKLFNRSFANIINDATLKNHYFYDPRVIYDSEQDRYMMCVLYGDQPGNSNLFVLFSKTNDPTKAWSIYKINGDLNGNSWTDYPSLGINRDEAFITTNLFDNANQFVESVIWQINKSNGYNGDVLSQKTWTGISGRPFNPVPASYGHKGSYGPEMHFISNEPLGGKNIFLYTISNTIDKNPNISFKTIEVPTYRAPVDAIQLNSDRLLDQGRCRVRSVFILNEIIHITFTGGNSNGFGQLQYYRLDVKNLVVASAIFDLNGTDYAYPSVCSYTNDPLNRTALICFLATSADRYPECRAVICDHDMNFSVSSLVKKGDNYVNAQPNLAIERWGDYTGIARHHGAAQPTAWLAGGYGTNSQGLGTWIAQVSREKDSLLVSPVEEKISIYPNPAQQDIYIKIELPESKNVYIDLVSADGKWWNNCWQQSLLRSSVYQITLNKTLLAPGVYFLLIKSGEEIIKKEKIIITNP